jgi:hypothetical protein
MVKLTSAGSGSDFFFVMLKMKNSNIIPQLWYDVYYQVFGIHTFIWSRVRYNVNRSLYNIGVHVGHRNNH